MVVNVTKVSQKIKKKKGNKNKNKNKKIFQNHKKWL